MKNSRVDGVIYAKYKHDDNLDRIIEIDEQFTRFLGYTMEDITAQDIGLMDLIFEEDKEVYSALVDKCFAEREEAYIAHYVKAMDGSAVFVFCYGKRYTADNGHVIIEVIIGELTGLYKSAQKSQENQIILKSVLDNFMGGVGIFTVDGRQFSSSYLSEGFFDVIGMDKDMFANDFKDFSRLLYGEDILKLYRDVGNCISTGNNTIGEYRFINLDNGFHWMQVRFSLLDKEEGLPRISAFFMDITDSKLEQQRLQARNKELSFKSEIDSLTGVYNHNAFIQHAISFMEQHKGVYAALLIIDIDDFKLVNDILGHYEGDRVLMETAKRLNELSVNKGFAGRLGGDEFAIFLNRVAGQGDAVAFAEDLCNNMSEIKLKTGFSVSVGIYGDKSGQETFQDLYAKADQALYAAKRAGKNGYVLYDNIRKEAKYEEKDIDSSFFSESGFVLDEMSDIIYICDAENYELLFINKVLKEHFHIESDDEAFYKGKKCYEILHGFNKPCDYCTKECLAEKGDYLFQYHENKTNHNYVCKERMVYFANRKARMIVAMDVTDGNDIVKALSGRFELEEALKGCMLEMASSVEYKKTCRKTLSILGDYYRADRICFFTDNGENKDYFEWYGSRMDALLDDDYHIKEQYRNGIWCNEILDNKPVVLNEVEGLKKSKPEIYQQLMDSKVWSLYSMPVKHERLKGKLLVCNPKNHLGDLTVLELLTIFLSNEISKWEIWQYRKYEVYHDKLTGTLNRAAYIDDISKLQDADRLGYLLADVDNLKEVNNQFGFEYGNQMVKQIADILKNTFDGYKVYRFDGDDFAVCCENIEKTDFMERVDCVRTLLEAHPVGASIGYVWDDFDKNLQVMNTHAEEMLKLNKQKCLRRNVSDNQDARKYSEENVSKWLNNGNFMIYLQPKIDLNTDELCGAEALVRLNHPVHGILTPDRFIPQLETVGIIAAVDLWVFEQVCETLHRWKREGKTMVPVSFNFSRKTLLEEELIEKMEEIIKRYQVDREYLEVEITETVGSLEHDMVSEIAKRLHGRSFRLSMDDFGTKYSSISVLSLMRFDELKIDRSMVWNLAGNEISQKLVKHIIAMCADIGIECIAEGVETEEQRQLLKSLNCVKAQGYYYSKPISVKEFEEYYN